jgi:hypothetical protein
MVAAYHERYQAVNHKKRLIDDHGWKPAQVTVDMIPMGPEVD